LVLPAPEQAGQLVPRDAEQPAAERALPGVVVPAPRRRGDAHEHLLRQVGGVGVLQAAAPGEAVDQPAVPRDELPPGGAVRRVAQAGEQAGTGKQGVSHQADLFGGEPRRGERSLLDYTERWLSPPEVRGCPSRSRRSTTPFRNL